MIDLLKLETLGPLQHGKHASPAEGACVMEAAAFVAGAPWSDEPRCVCPVIGTFLRNWNDTLSTDADRDRLLRPLIPTILNTRADAAVEKRRSHMALDWLIRVNLPAWLRLAKLDGHADAVAALQPLLNPDAVAAAQSVLYAARDAAWGTLLGHGARTAATLAAENSARVAARKVAAIGVVSATVADLQLSAVDLVERMAALKEEQS